MEQLRYDYKQNYRIRWLNIIIVIMILSFGFFFVLINKSEWILSVDSPKIIKLIVSSLNEPSDYYNDVLRNKIIVTDNGYVSKVNFKLKYTGKYQVGMLLKRYSQNDIFAPTAMQYKVKLKMKIDITKPNGEVLFSTIVDKYYPFIRDTQGSDEGGMSFVFFECPKDLPAREMLICNSVILESDTELYNKYGAIDIFINKVSDI